MAGLLPTGAAAEDERGVLVVQGRGGTIGELVVTQDLDLRSPVPTFTGGGDYAGVLIEAPDARSGDRFRRLGGVQIRAFRDGTGDAVGVLGIDVQIPPGTYRVTLLGQGPVRATFPMNDQSRPAVTASPRTAIPARFLGRAVDLTGTLSGDTIDLGTLPGGRRALQVTLLKARHVDRLRMCVTTAKECERSPFTEVPYGSATGEAQIVTRLHEPVTTRRSMRWELDGARTDRDRLRAAVLVF